MLSAHQATASSSSTEPSERDIRHARNLILKNDNPLAYINSQNFAISTLMELVELANDNEFIAVGDALALQTVIGVAKTNDVNNLNLLLTKSAYYTAIFQPDANGMTALHWASQIGHFEIVKILLKNLRGRSASLKSHIKFNELILLAAKNNHQEIVLYFLDESESLAELKLLETSLLTLEETVFPPLQKRIAELCEVFSALDGVVAAAYTNDFLSVQKYLNQYGCIHLNKCDQFGDNILVLAAVFNRTAIINLIMAYGAATIIDPVHFQLAIQSAAKYGFTEVVSILLPSLHSIDLIRGAIIVIRGIQSLTFQQGLTINRRPMLRPPCEVYEPDLEGAMKIKQSLPLTIQFLQARINQLQNRIYSFKDFVIALKRHDQKYIEDYIESLTNMQEPRHVLEATFNIGLLATVLIYLGDTKTTSTLIPYFIEKIQNPEDIRYAYLLFSNEQRELPVAKDLLTKLKKLKYVIGPNTLLSNEDRIEKLIAAGFNVVVPNEYNDPIEHSIMQRPISVCTRCRNSSMYDQASLLKYFITSAQILEYHVDPLTRIAVHIEELTNGVSIFAKSAIENFVSSQEALHAPINVVTDNMDGNGKRARADVCQIRDTLFSNKKNKIADANPEVPEDNQRVAAAPGN